MITRLSSSPLEASLEGAAWEIVSPSSTLPLSARSPLSTITGFQFGRRCMAIFRHQIDLPQQSKERPSVPILGQVLRGHRAAVRGIQKTRVRAVMGTSFHVPYPTYWSILLTSRNR